MNLALALGVRDPFSIFDWDWEVVAAWLSYARFVQPIGEQANDLRHAFHDYYFALANKKKGTDVKLGDFILSQRVKEAPGDAVFVSE